MAENGTCVLSVEDLHTYFYTQRGIVKAVNGVSFAVDRGRTLCLVGESGCGKSVAALSIMRLITTPPGKIVRGSIQFEGRDLLGLDPEEMRRVRGRRISMIFQALRGHAPAGDDRHGAGFPRPRPAHRRRAHHRP